MENSRPDLWQYRTLSEVPTKLWKTVAILMRIANDAGVYELSTDPHFDEWVKTLIEENDFPVLDENDQIETVALGDRWKTDRFSPIVDHCRWEDGEFTTLEYHITHGDNKEIPIVIRKERSLTFLCDAYWSNSISVHWDGGDGEFSHQQYEDEDISCEYVINGEVLAWTVKP